MNLPVYEKQTRAADHSPASQRTDSDLRRTLLLLVDWRSKRPPRSFKSILLWHFRSLDDFFFFPCNMVCVMHMFRHFKLPTNGVLNSFVACSYWCVKVLGVVVIVGVLDLLLVIPIILTDCWGCWFKHQVGMTELYKHKRAVLLL